MPIFPPPGSILWRVTSTTDRQTDRQADWEIDRQTERQTGTDNWFYCTDFLLFTSRKEISNFELWRFRSCAAEVIYLFACKAESSVRESRSFEGTYCLRRQTFINLTILNGWTWKMMFFQNVGFALSWNWVWKLKTVWARTEITTEFPQISIGMT
jgi:hypothetical protein